MKKLSYALATAFLFLICCFSIKTMAKENDKYLFIGNSYTFYNNVPELFENFVEKGTGKDIDVTGCCYVGRTLKTHADAIAAVIRCRGNVDELTESEKLLFTEYRMYNVDKVDTGFAENVFNDYAEVIWDKEKSCVKKYDHIVLQPYYKNGNGDNDAEALAESIISIMNSLGNKDTNFIVRITFSIWVDGLERFVNYQNIIDEMYKNAVNIVKKEQSLKGTKYNMLYYSMEGRALSNYLMYSGMDRAVKNEPIMYDVYSNFSLNVGYTNDIFLGDKIHTTILGGYIQAATLYESINSMEYRNAGSRWVSSIYRGATNTRIRNFGKDGIRGVNFGLFYNNRAGIASGKICEMATFIAEQTQLHSMRLDTKESAFEWMTNPKVDNFNYVDESDCLRIVFMNNNDEFIADMILRRDSLYDKISVNPNKYGYYLAGWKTDKDKDTIDYPADYTFSKQFIMKNAGKEFTLYPEYKLINTTVVYDNNWPANHKEKSITYHYGNQIFSNAFNRIGYVQTGWSENPYSTDVQYKPGQAMQNIWLDENNNRTIILYAVWKKVETSVTFNYNMGANSYLKTYKYKICNPNNAFPGKLNRTGYEHIGWCISPGGNGNIFMPGDKVTDNFVSNFNGKELVFYAVWDKKNITVNYSRNYAGNKKILSQTYVYGDKNKFLSKFKRAGYEQIGWSTKPGSNTVEIKNLANISDSFINRNGGKTITLYAVWKRISVKINYSRNYAGNKKILSQTYVYGGNNRFLSRFQRVGYVQIGWSTRPGQNTVQIKNLASISNSFISKYKGKTITLYAVWKKK